MFCYFKNANLFIQVLANIKIGTCTIDEGKYVSAVKKRYVCTVNLVNIVGALIALFTVDPMSFRAVKTARNSNQEKIGHKEKPHVTNKTAHGRSLPRRPWLITVQ